MNRKRVMKGLEAVIATCVFSLGAIGGLIVAAFLFPGNTPLQIVGIVVGEAVAIFGSGWWRPVR